MYDKQVRRRRAALAAFVLASLILLTAYFGEQGGGALHAIQRGAQQALSPIEEGASRAFKPFSDLVNWIGDTVDAKGENNKLKKELSQQRQELAQAETDRNEAQQLRGLVGLRRQGGFPNQFKNVTGRVIARSPTAWYSTVQIDAGSGDGVAVNQPVITSGGLAGRVSSVTGGTATVTLITDSSSGVAAQVMPNGTTGVIRPEVGNPNDMLLDFIQKGSPVKKGSVVVTSGFSTRRHLESLFPRGIPIGRVSRVEAGELSLYQRVHIKPFADFHRMDFGQVLLTRPGGSR